MTAPAPAAARPSVTPYISADRSLPEFTDLAVILGALLAVVLGAANVYLGLKVGMTVSASIPAAVISMAVLRGLLRRGNILQNNIAQTIASTGEAVAAGIIFTVPALVLVGVWKDFAFWPTTLIAVGGGLLGVVFMIPLRRALIVEEEGLTYPEGVACAEVLITGDTGGKSIKTLVQGFYYGGGLKLATAGLGLMQGTVEWGATLGQRVLYFGADVSAALVGVGYIINLQVASLVLLGGLLGWVVVIPWLQIPEALAGKGAIEVAWTLWSTRVRYIGVGAMAVAGLWSLVSVRHGIARSLSGLRSGYRNRATPTTVLRTERDFSLATLGALFFVATVLLFGLYQFLLDSIPLALLTLAIMVVAGFFFAAVSSYICGLVGSSNNPASGMVICTVLGTSALLLALGMSGDSAILATLGVAGAVCCALAVAADTSQDLKTGQLLGATPRKLQLAQVVGVLASAFVMAPTLTLLHEAYGIGKELQAPQATLFAGLAQAMVGTGELQTDMILIGMGLAVVLILLDRWLQQRGSRWRLYVMPTVIGIYLPLALSVTLFLGGVVRAVVDSARRQQHQEVSESEDAGILMASGLIAGEAILGIVIAVLISLGWRDTIAIAGVWSWLASALAVASVLVLMWKLRRSGPVL